MAPCRDFTVNQSNSPHLVAVHIFYKRRSSSLAEKEEKQEDCLCQKAGRITAESQVNQTNTCGDPSLVTSTSVRLGGKSRESLKAEKTAQR